MLGKNGKGKKTLYSPGVVTAWCLLFEVGVYSVYWLITSGTFVKSDLWGLAFVAFLIIFMIRLPFIISNKINSTKHSYTVDSVSPMSKTYLNFG